MSTVPHQTNTVPVGGAQQFDQDGLAAYLRDQGRPFQGPLRVEQLTGGQSNPTYLVTAGAERYVLRSKLNLVPDRDVKLLPVGEPALALQSLERGVVDAASFSMPQLLVAKRMGFRELVNYDKLGIVYPYNTATTLRQTVSKNPELLEKVSKTIIEGISIFKTNKEKSLAVWKKYLRGVADDVLEETYPNTRSELEQVPIPSLQVIKSGLDILSLQYPQAKQTDPNLIIDPSFVRRIDQSGFIGSLYKK